MSGGETLQTTVAHRGSKHRQRGLDRSLDRVILDAALAGVVDMGYERMSMDDLAKRAGVGKAAIYRRWSSKAEVVAAAIAQWRRGHGPTEPPDTGTLRGDVEAFVDAFHDYSDTELKTVEVILGVATAATRDSALAAALDDFALAIPRRIIRTVLDRAVARGEIATGRDLSLVPDAALGLTVVRMIAGRPIDRTYVRRVFEDVILPLATAPTGHGS
ncbi:TetR/AcrR family transcriptional regulator [Nocardia brevicatena]|uniref:TetR/AcrR family transcriptional regulator n=1 Tax=Nocardia brevicatena TaxID=37327 RepID=UPI0003077B22|nr:TetR/AcrR family transcriptional regulator [Nocardia brevicatena]